VQFGLQVVDELARGATRAAGVLTAMDPERVAVLLALMDPDQVAVLLAAMHPDRAAAGHTAVLHYRRADNDYAGWGLHVWTGAANPTEWTNPLPPAGFDAYGAVFRVPLVDGAGRTPSPCPGLVMLGVSDDAGVCWFQLPL